jgi:hypothetical protein
VDGNEVTISNNDVDVRSDVGEGLVYPPPPGPLDLPEMHEMVEHLNRTSNDLNGNLALDFNGDGTVGADDLGALLEEWQKRR